MSERKTPVGEAEDPGLLQKKRARRRLIGAVTFTAVAALVLSLALDQEPRPLRDDLVLKMPARDAGDSRAGGGAGDREAELTPPPDDGPEPVAAVRPSKADSRPSQGSLSPAAVSAPAVSTPPAAAPPVASPSVPTPSVSALPAMPATAGGPFGQGNSTPGAVIDSSVNPPQVITPPSAALPSVFAPFPDAPPPPPAKGGKVEPKAEPRAESRLDPKPDSKPISKPKPEKKPEPKPEKRPEPKHEAKHELKPEKKPEPKREASVASGSGSGLDADGDDAIARIAKSRAAQDGGTGRPATATASAPAKAGPYRLQVGAFSSVASAESAIAKLKAAGFSASRETIRGSGGAELIRVRTGSYPDRAAAQRAHDTLQARGVSTTVIAP